MKKHIALAIALSTIAFGVRAQFVATLNDGNDMHLINDNSFVESAEGYSIGGIDISEIGKMQHVRAMRPVYIIDINPSVETSERNLYSSEYMLKVAGLSYRVTTDVSLAAENASMILLSARITSSALTPEQWDKLKAYVADGGILLCPGIESNVKTAFEIFGIESRKTVKEHKTYSWIDCTNPELVYFDTPEEQTVSFAKRATDTISTTVYTTSTGTAMAYYDDNRSDVAVVKNNYGKGVAYTFGFRWRDVIQRSQLNKDFEAQRGSSNSFDPGADNCPFFIRAAHAANYPVSAWKYTVPDGYSTVLIPTHDCDSRTAYDEMHYIADYEKSLGLHSHFFLTVHYFRQQGYMSAFYCDETIPKVKALLAEGHTVGSHSLCHFPDFDVTDRFPMTVYTRDEYPEIASRNLETGISSGSTWAELVLSKQILEGDLGNKVRSFRSGHLCVNKNMPEAHKIAGYNFSSCYTACDVLSEFPFIQRMGNDWSGDETGTLQMPLHFSDVFSGDKSMNETNWQEKIPIWWDIFCKLKNNYASSILLIHPNRDWKMEAQKMLIGKFDSTCGLFNFEDYGDFWLARDAFEFDTYYNESSNIVVVRANAADIKANPHLSVFVQTKASSPKILLVDETGKCYPTNVKIVAPDRHLLMLR